MNPLILLCESFEWRAWCLFSNWTASSSLFLLLLLLFLVNDLLWSFWGWWRNWWILTWELSSLFSNWIYWSSLIWLKDVGNFHEYWLEGFGDYSQMISIWDLHQIFDGRRWWICGFNLRALELDFKSFLTRAEPRM